MKLWLGIGLGVIGAAAGAAAIGHRSYRNAMNQAEDAYALLATRAAAAATARFEPHHLDGLPEIAQRYLLHAIAPGTPIYSAVELEMHGTFLLGDKPKYQTYRMSARQVLRAPDQFVWVPRMQAGPVKVSGSDGLVAGQAWTRFWLQGLIPVAQDRSSPDLVRSAQFRAAVEGALLLPTSLLPTNGVEWEQVGPDRARITLRRFSPPIVLEMTLNEKGAVRQVVGSRWSNANPDRAFRYQSFGGTMKGDRTFQGLTIPTEIDAGNHFGTENYLPFFQARIKNATYF